MQLLWVNKIGNSWNMRIERDEQRPWIFIQDKEERLVSISDDPGIRINDFDVI